MSGEPESKIISDLSENEKDKSICIEVNECPDQIEKTDLKDNKTSVVIRIEPGATGATETVEKGQNKTETDILNSNCNNPCEKHEDPSVSLTESENTTASLTSEDDDQQGVLNPAFIEDEEEKETNKKKKGHQRQPSCSPNKDIESISGILEGGSGKTENVIINPPILTDQSVTDSGKNDKQYSEYFMPSPEYKTQLGDYKKTKKSPSVAKIFCWIISCLLLTGAIIIAVLIGTGIIDTDPSKNIKVSRKLQPELDTKTEELPVSVQLLEVKADDVPNVLTNNPDFFLPKKDARYFDGKMRITNVEWNSNYQDNRSYQYQELADILQAELDALLNEYYPNFKFESNILRLMEGSVIAVFEIKASLKSDGSDVINEDNILDAIINNLEREMGYLFGKFIVSKESVEIQEKPSASTPIYVVLEGDEDEVDSLEQQLEIYESEIFSKPRLEPITELINDERTENNIELVTTTTLAESRTHSKNSMSLSSSDTTTKIVIESNSIFNKTTPTTTTETNQDVIATANTLMKLDTKDRDQLTDDIESRTDIYDQSEISNREVDVQSEYLETQSDKNDNIELEYFKSSEAENEYEFDSSEQITTDANINILELNTLQPNIINS